MRRLSESLDMDSLDDLHPIGYEWNRDKAREEPEHDVFCATLKDPGKPCDCGVEEDE